MIFLSIYSNDVGDASVTTEDNTKGIILSLDTFQVAKLNLIQKDDTYHVIYNNDLRVYVQSPPWQGEINIYPNPSIPKAKISFTKMKVKYFDFLELLCSEMSTKCRQQVGVYGNHEEIKKYGNFFPFLKVYNNDMNERCVLVELDGEEQLVPLAQIHEKKYRCVAVLKVGIIKPYSKMAHLVLNMTVEELKLSTNLSKEVGNKQKPELRFAHKIKF